MRPDLLAARFDLIAMASHSVKYCQRHGITADATVAADGVFISPIRPDGRWFDPDPDGEAAVWVDVYNQDGDDPVDVAAWLPDKPDRVMTFCGAGTALGMRFAADPNSYVFNRPLRVFSHPLAWLQGDCRGIVVLNDARAARWMVDLQPPTVEVDDWRASSALKRSIAAVTSLRIVVSSRERRTAA